MIAVLAGLKREYGGRDGRGPLAFLEQVVNERISGAGREMEASLSVIEDFVAMASH